MPLNVKINASTKLVRGKRDMFTGQRRNKARKISFSNKKSRKWQEVNIQKQKIFWPEGQRLVKLRISSKTIRTIEKKGLSVVAKAAGVNLWKQPFKDLRTQRLEYREKKAGTVPVARKSRNNSGLKKEGLGGTKRLSLKGSPSYIGGRIFYVRDDAKAEIDQLIESQKKKR